MNKKKYKKVLPIVAWSVFIFLIYLMFNQPSAYSWGFYAHKKINRMAVYTLPPSMIGFYKKHIEYITEHATDPDKRSFSDENEAVRHYIDIDYYGESPFDSMPNKWKKAVEKYSEDTLLLYGINPWWVEVMYYRLINAFKEKNADKILFISANLGHYIGDACTPLHTSQYYDGKNKQQKGIHAFWESRIPELFGYDYNFMVGQAQYIAHPNSKIWELVKSSHEAIDTIFQIQDSLNNMYNRDQVYAFENKGKTTAKVFSKQYAKQFTILSENMIERRMQVAVNAVGCFWYSAWVQAGQPDLSVIEMKDTLKSNSFSTTQDSIQIKKLSKKIARKEKKI